MVVGRRDALNLLAKENALPNLVSKASAVMSAPSNGEIGAARAVSSGITKTPFRRCRPNSTPHLLAAKTFNQVVILKADATVVRSPRRCDSTSNTTANSALSKAGSGDVLSGHSRIAFLSLGMDRFDAGLLRPSTSTASPAEIAGNKLGLAQPPRPRHHRRHPRCDPQCESRQ